MAVRKIDWRNVLERALWTFVEGFIVALPVTLSMDMNGATWKSILFSALMGGVSALKTCALDLIKQHNEQYKEIEPDIDFYEDDSELEDEDLDDVFPLNTGDSDAKDEGEKEDETV